MIEVHAEVEVPRPADEVFTFLADASNNPRWQRGMRSCQWRTDGPIEVGAIYEQEAAFLGRPIRSVFEVVELEPGRSIRIRTIESSFPIDVTRAVQPLGDHRTRVHATVRGDASGVFWLTEPLLRRMVQRSVRGDYQRLRSLLAATS